MRSKNKQQQQFALSHKEKFQNAGSLCYIIEFYLDCWVTLVRFLSIVRIDLKIDKKNYGQNNIDVVSFVSDIWKFLNSRWEIWYQKYGNCSDVQFVFDMALFCVDILKH